MSSEGKRENYHIISLIGKGAYGQVYKARKKLTGQFVAIKTIKKKGKQEKDIKAMRQQITILKKLKHPNIVVLLDSFQTNSEFIIVTQLGQGELFNIIEDDQYLQQPEIRKVAQQLIRALHYIHSNRITHRDLKPQNILMTSEGNIKLCDFGFARYMSYKTEVLTSLKGTPLYMAPQVVQEQPYNHTADLWSLGVILYELATGSPPFSAANLLTLVEHISKDPVRYPQSIQGDFKNLLKGLLNKDPNARLGWPQLLNHPFIRQTQQEKIERKQKIDKFSNWIEENHYMQDQQNSSSSKSINQGNFQEKSRQISPLKPSSSSNSKPQVCSDTVWNNYLKISADEKGANQLRVDSQFLDKLLTVVSSNVGQIMRNKQQKSLLNCSLKVLTQVLMKSKTPENKQADISKKLNIPNHLLNLMRAMLKMDNGKNYIETISDIVKLIGLLGKTTFNKSLGIQMVYVRSFIPLLPSLLNCVFSGSDNYYQGLTMNLLRTIGIFANNASVHYLRSFSFYKDIVEIKFVPELLNIFKYYSSNINVIKILVQVVSAFMHPVFGDIELFPWKRANFNGILEFKQFSTMLECVRQSLINGLLEIDWMNYFEMVLNLDDESAVLPKISVKRIILQALRQSKQFGESLLIKPNSILKHIFTTISNPNPIVYSTACLIISQILKHIRQTKKEKDSSEKIEKQYITDNLISIIITRIEQQSGKSYSLILFSSFSIIQQLLWKPSLSSNRLIQFMMTDRFFKIVCNYLSNSDKSKLQEMRNLEGSNYGLHSIAYYDPVFLLVHRLIVKSQKQTQEIPLQMSRLITNSNLQSKMVEILTKLSSKSDISPRGLIAYLMLLYDIICIKLNNQFIQSNLLKNLINLLNQNQIQAIFEWPVNFGGGGGCLQILLGTLMNIFLQYLQHVEKEPDILKTIFQSQLIRLIVEFAKYLNQQNITTVITFLAHLLSFSSDKIGLAKQFIQFGGLAIFVRFNLLKLQQYQPSSVVEACNLLSQLARLSKETYEHIASIEPFNDIKSMLKSSDVEVKSRALYLLGNLCRHSSLFYEKLIEYDLIKEILLLCNSDDKETKKYGCIALGNAGFHDSKLYPHLRMAIPILVGLLKDSDQKTRSNAAAALGNLARNSQELDQDFISTGANYQLVNMIINDKSFSAKRVSIMAIINLLNLKQSSKLLKSLSIGSILTKYVPPNFTSDPNLIKTAQKALDKLN